MECIVHFRVVHGKETKELRGLIMLKEGEQPGVDQLVTMFGDMGFAVKPDSGDELVFRTAEPQASFDYIRVTEIDTGEEVYREDHNLRSILENLLPPR
ncbi:hypothetical protein Q5741_09510 [Paenibacillus sp. JX-17]|uniref:Uncharacterized protein n=1 Tax=Paenibacillus lacisoli TaxID=3064525 RepID=A0ABT9CFD8_9BACL|nr:hypothetical protein [Paenibacillus sp. JX-17]MDO7906657.1 hypothetical protein [Paenibacillus sp. JX-17]